MAFLQRGILVPEGVHCRSVHMYKCQLTYEALKMIESSKPDYVILNSDDAKNFID